MEDYLLQLNESQREAVQYTDGPALVIAGAGSGKTRVLTYKIVHLLKLGYKPHTILALTFTNKAAREMKERIALLIGDELASRLWMGTFHSIFARILRLNAELLGFKSNFTIYDTTDSKSLIKQIVKDMQLDAKDYDAGALQSLFSNLKNQLISPDRYAASTECRLRDEKAHRPLTHAVYTAYCDRCKVADAMDFDDLLVYTNVLLKDHPDVLEKYQNFFQYVLVDEYQDTNFAQHLIVQRLTDKHKRMCVVGDDAQSIYSFRGANISNILELKTFYPTLRTFKLEQNYRSTQNIINAANSLIAKNKKQIEKHIFSNNSIGSKVKMIQTQSDYAEAYTVAGLITSLKAQQGSAYEDFAILYRTNAQSRILEEALRQRNMPYRIYGGLSFYQRKEIKDAVSYFRMTVNPDDDEALRRSINTPARGIGDTTVGKIQHAAISNGASMWSVINNPDQYALNINQGTRKKLDGYKALINEFIAANANGSDASQMYDLIITKTLLIEELTANKLTPENISRKENLEELGRGVQDFVMEQSQIGGECSLNEFLATISLATDEDSENSDGNCINLMTVHAAKGLEFKNVIIVGVEENLFPSSMSIDSPYAIEEERRLLYVAITRAETDCVITFASSRFRNGETTSCQASRFLSDIDLKYVNVQMSETAGGYSWNSSKFDNYSRPAYSSGRVSRADVPKPKPVTPSVINNIPRSTLDNVPHRTIIVKSSTPPPPAASSANCAIHNASELAEGMQIRHDRFGKGVITKIVDPQGDAKIAVKFDYIGEKNLLLRFAKFEIL